MAVGSRFRSKDYAANRSHLPGYQYDICVVRFGELLRFLTVHSSAPFRQEPSQFVSPRSIVIDESEEAQRRLILLPSKGGSGTQLTNRLCQYHLAATEAY